VTLRSWILGKSSRVLHRSPSFIQLSAVADILTRRPGERCRPKFVASGSDPVAVIDSNSYFELAPLDNLRTADLWDARIPEGVLDTTTGALELEGSTIIGPMHPNRYRVRRWGHPRSSPSSHDVILPLIGDIASGKNYYHWMVDVLPRASVLQCLESDLRPTIVVPHNRNSFVDESLVLLDERYGIHDVSYCKSGQRLRFTNAYLAAYPLRDFGAILPPALIQWVRDVFQTEDISPDIDVICASGSGSSAARFSNSPVSVCGPFTTITSASFHVEPSCPAGSDAVRRGTGSASRCWDHRWRRRCQLHPRWSSHDQSRRWARID
jgi:hypothetical protein